ncbi:MAG: PAS domain S-box protein [Leptolyngbyaceae bacterium]|nr:PAS domain S-box protein [Leptolyngbyaceae bacterium]
MTIQLIEAALIRLISIETFGFMPHGNCYLWQPRLVGLHFASDMLIALAYYSIPLMLLYFVRQRDDVPFPKIFLLFSGFIFACGTSHLMAVWTLWYPTYWISGGIKALTALISVATAFSLVSIIPQALTLPSPGLLQQINDALQQEIESHRKTEEQLQLFVRHSPAAIAMFDQNIRYLLNSDRWLRDYGLEAETIIGRCHYDVFPEIPERWKQLHQTCLQGEVLTCEEDSFVRVDGSTEWLRWELHPWYEHNGDIGGLIMFTEVTTEKRQMQRDLQTANERLEAEVHLRTQELRQLNQQMQFHLNNTPLAVIEWGADLRVKQWSHQAEIIFGWRADEMIGRSLADETWLFVHEEDAIAVEQKATELRQQQIPRNFSSNRNYTKNGNVVYCNWYNSALFDEAGELVSILSLVKDTTSRHRSEMQLQQSEARFRNTFEQAAVGLAHLSINGQWLRVNQRLCNILGYERDDLLQRTFQDITHPDDLDTDIDYILQILTRKIDHYAIEKRYRRADYSYIWVNLTVSLTWRNANSSNTAPSADTPDYFIVVVEDISDRKRIEAELFQEKELAEVTLKSIGDGVLTTNAVGEITYVNPIGEQLTGWHNEEAMGQPATTILNIVHESTREPVASPVEQALQEKRIVELANHTILLSKDGREYPIEDSAAPIFDRDSNLMGTVLIFRDVSQSRELSRQLSWQARHDGLTGLINRWAFEQELTHMIANLSEGNPYHSLCYLDLDQFKIVNDTCGHGAGDELLRQVTQLLQHNIRASDILARLGGDEFGILLQGCSVNHAVAIAEKIRQQIQDFRFIWNEKSFAIGVSIGIVTLSSDIEELQNLAAVLSAADAACYAAKDAGRNRVHVYQVNDNTLSQQRSERQWTVKIRHALEQNRFQLHYQPVVPTDPDHSPLGAHYEILVRMVDEEGGLIPPMAFIPAAERYNLMPEIDQWVVQTTFEYYDSLTDQIMATAERNTPPKLMINLSGTSLCNERFLALLVDWFQSGRVPSSLICFEITETAAIANLSQATEFIRILKTFGCQFALDDFGSGMSSFGYLKILPVDYLKIDGNFVRDILDDPVDYTIVRFIHSLSETLGMKTIAEFVENQQVRDRLQTIGVDYVQGYGICRPIPFAIALEFPP